MIGLAQSLSLVPILKFTLGEVFGILFKGSEYFEACSHATGLGIGPYTIQLTVPANTNIQAHTHPDDRVAVVVSGTWYFGYGSRFDEKQFKALPPGSFYTEPSNDSHFAHREYGCRSHYFWLRTQWH